MEKKVVPLTLVSDGDEAQGIVETVFSVFGNVDEGNDVIHPGSFTKTFQERANKVRILDQHNTDSIMRALGRPLEFRELRRDELPQKILDEYPEATGGAYAKLQFLMNTPEGKGAFERIKAGAVSEWSFGYDVIQKDFSDDKQIRNLREIKLYELGPVLFAMNPATATVSAKEAELMDNEEQTEVEQEQAKRVLPFQEDLSLAERNLPWDADAAERRVRDWAGYNEEDDEAMDWGKYRRAFLWYDAGNEDTLQAYKLPYADIIDDELTAVPRGIFAAAAVLQGGRGGTSIPDDDQEEIRGVVSRWYARMREAFDDDGIVPSWEKEDEPEVEAEDAGDEPDEKAGRIIAARNAARIQQAIGTLVEVLVDAGLMEPIETDDKEESEQQDGAEPTEKSLTPSEDEAGPSPTPPSADVLREIDLERADIEYALVH